MHEVVVGWVVVCLVFFFQAEEGYRFPPYSRGLGEGYKGQSGDGEAAVLEAAMALTHLLFGPVTPLMGPLRGVLKV